MQVNVFIKEIRVGEEPTLLVLPYGPSSAIPKHLRGIEWRNLAVTSSSDSLLGASDEAIRGAISLDGYAIVRPTG
jgi:hypothetical protein